MFLNSFNHFRAIAIAIIVAGHCHVLAAIQFNTFPERVIGTLITGGTGLFVFISGFLFHHVFYEKYHFGTFMRSKVKKVLIPCLLLSTLPIVWKIIRASQGQVASSAENTPLQYVWSTAMLLWRGDFMLAYWYIPFIMVTFLLSPLHALFVRVPLGYRIGLIVVLSVIAAFIHRPIPDHWFCVFQSVLYFTPIYLFGIVCSMNSHAIYARFAGREWLVLLVAVGLAAAQVWSGHVGNYHKDPWGYGGIDLMYFQKAALCLFFMIWLNRFEMSSHRVLHLVASTRFAIFFLHPYLPAVAYRQKQAHPGPNIQPWAAHFVLVVVTLTLCAAMAAGLLASVQMLSATPIEPQGPALFKSPVRNAG